MKRFIILIISFLCFTQAFSEEHLKFLGFPIDGTVNEYASKLMSKGFYISPDNEYANDSARMRIKMSYDQNVKETISSLKTLANDMSSGFVTFKKFQTRRYQYNPDADATLYASRLLRAASILEFLLTDPDNKS